MSMLHFKTLKCDYVCLEAGIGGTNSVTNIFESCISTIVSIGLDHQDILGHSIEEITKNKAGVIKRNASLVIGNTVDQSIVKNYIQERNKEGGCNLNLAYRGHSYIWRITNN
jgi:dihydrofolate synthase / folylpolyglutamate synthase